MHRILVSFVCGALVVLTAPLFAADAIEEARALLAAGKKAEALAKLKSGVAELQKKVAAAPDDAAAHFQLARLWLELQADDKAQAALDQALELKPNEPEYHALKGLALFYAEQPEAAEKEYQAAIKLAPREARWVHEYAKFLISSERNEEVEPQLRRALELDTKYAPAILDLASVQVEKDRIDDAAKLLQEGIAAHPDNAEMREFLGQIYQQQEQHAAAYEQYEALRKLEPTSIRAEAKLLQLATSLGKGEDAEKHLARVHELFKAGKAQQPFFCREQFDEGKHRVTAFEFFELKSPHAVRYRFEVMPPGEEESYAVSLGSYDFSNEAARASEIIARDERVYHLDFYRGDEHRTYGMFLNKPPNYAETRAMVIEVIQGKRKVLSASTSGKK